MTRAGLLIGCLLISGCERGLHEMYDQAKYKPLAPSGLFADDNSSRPQVDDTVVYSSGALAGSSSGRQGRLDDADGNPPAPSLTQLRRGRERFDIYCAPCHGALGDGRGFIVQRGFPAPPSFDLERLRQAPNRHLFEVITRGYGVMYPYADRVSIGDRWAIVSYIRALQLSRRAPVSLLDATDRMKLEQATP